MKNSKDIPEYLFDIEIKTLQGSILDWSICKGKKILIVNTASECGFTKQYKDLQKISEKYADTLTVIGVPCNQFGQQEPGDSEQIEKFCSLNFGVTFPLTEKVDVKGPEQHPLYSWLTQKKFNGVKSSTVKWNFQKYLLDENGKLIDYYYSITKPMSSKIVKKIEAISG